MRHGRPAIKSLALAALAAATFSAVSAEPLVAPDVMLAAAPTTVISGGSTRLNWKSANATACTAAGGWGGSLPTSGSRSTGPIAASTEYEVICTGSGGSATQSVTVTVAAAPPTVQLGVSPSTITFGNAATLRWSATNAATCAASGGWAGAQAATGSQSTGNLEADATYILTCTGPGGASSQSATVSVTTPAPTVSLSASPSTVGKGAHSTLRWSSANTTSCVAGGAWSGVKAVTGSVSTGALSANSTYTLTCSGSGGIAAQSETITVGSGSAPMVNLNATPSTVKSGAGSTLSWSAANATSCVASGAWSGAKPISGLLTTSALAGDATYALTCTGTGGTAVQSTTVSVTAPAPILILKASPATVRKSDSSALEWVSSNATSCSGSGAWSGTKPLRGSQSTGAVTENGTYILTCSGPGGTAAQSATVSVTAPAPTVSLIAQPSTVDAGASTRLVWSTTNTTSCTASGAWSGSKAVYGSQSTGALSANATYSLTCAGIGGSATQSQTVTVATGLAPSVKLSADPSTVKNGAGSTLNWSAANAAVCTASGAWSGAKPMSGSQSTGAINGNQTYLLTCSGAGGRATQSVTVSVAAPAPTLNFSANPSTVNSGASSTLTWSAVNAAACTAIGAWAGAKAVNGSQSTGALKANASYTLTCTGSGGSASQSVTVAAASPAPVISLSATPSTVKSGAASTLNWSATQATSCTASGDWTGSKVINGSQSTGALAGTSTYTLTCAGAGGSASQSATVSVTASAPTVSLSVGPSAIASGGSSTMTWSSTNATSCTASGAWSGSKALQGTESTGALTANATYALTCSGTGGTASQSTTVSVKAPAPTVTLSASPSTVANGGSSTLSWSATNATACTASGAWAGSEGVRGSQSTGALHANAAYVLNCSGAGGSASQSATVTVSAPAPAVSLSANPSTVSKGATATLTWSSMNATSCAASGGWSGNEGTLGSKTTAGLIATTKFTLTCNGTGGSASQSATVTVSASTSPPGTASLSWVAPTLNTNGSPLTTLTGYHIFYGNSPNALTQSIAITSAATSYEITNLAPGTWYFAVAADSSDGSESAPSSVSSKTI
jgi:hypothetical protein